MKVISYSEVSTFLTCPRKYYWKYIRGLLPAETPKAFETGRQFHKGASGEEGEGVWYEIGKLSANYFGQYRSQQEVTGTIQLSKDLILKGIADGLTEDAVIERKTTSRANSMMVNALSISLQNRMYGLIFGRRKLLLQMTKKSQIRQRKTETDLEFEQRLLNEYKTKADDMFLQVQIDLNVENLIPEILQVMTNIKSCKRNKMWPGGNPYTCYAISQCPYMNLCLDEETFLPLYKTKEEK